MVQHKFHANDPIRVVIHGAAQTRVQQSMKAIGISKDGHHLCSLLKDGKRNRDEATTNVHVTKI